MKDESIVDRLMRYMKINTVSCAGNNTYPSTDTQKGFASILKDDLLKIGIKSEWIRVIKEALTICSIPATPGCEGKKHICLAAHIDTVGDVNMNINPILRDYQGGDVVLKSDVIIPAAELKGFEGQQIITSDGNTNIGGDDKAGLVGIMYAVKDILNSNIKHGPITLMFFPDEELGIMPIGYIKDIIDDFDCIFTFDGAELGTIDCESIYVYTANFKFYGYNAHPGVGGKNFKSAIDVLTKFIDHFNISYPEYSPNNSQDKEPFACVYDIKGTFAQSECIWYIGTFTEGDAEDIIDCMNTEAFNVANKFNIEFDLIFKKMCLNTGPIIQTKPWLLDIFKKSFKNIGYNSVCRSIRGGTDGGMINLTKPQVAAPNFGTGVRNVHEVIEWVSVRELEDLPKIIVEMIKETVKLK